MSEGHWFSGRGQGVGDDVLQVAPSRKLTDEEKQDARLVVCDGLLRPDEARMVLEMLGLVEA